MFFFGISRYVRCVLEMNTVGKRTSLFWISEVVSRGFFDKSFASFEDIQQIECPWGFPLYFVICCSKYKSTRPGRVMCQREPGR
jgi:hypothetical protein